MYVLLVDDSQNYARIVVEGLANKHHYRVYYALDAAEAFQVLSAQPIDVVIVDVLFRPVMEQFERLRRKGMVCIERGPFLDSGLAVLRQIGSHKEQSRPRPKVVVWTDGGDNRLLHMLWAYQQLNAKAFYYKDAGGNADATLNRAIQIAASDQSHISRELEEEGMSSEKLSLSETLFRDPMRWPYIWRALALGATSHLAIAERVQHRFKYKKSVIGDIAQEADNLNAIPALRGDPLGFCIAYANRHHLFFLDSAVKSHFDGLAGFPGIRT